MPKPHGRHGSSLRSSRGLALAAAAVALAFAPAGGALEAQEAHHLAPGGSDGPQIDLWVESLEPDLEFGFWVSEAAHVAVFDIVPGLGARLVTPGSGGAGLPAEAGTHHRRDLSFRRALARRAAAARWTHPADRVDHGYLLLVVSRTPLDLGRFSSAARERYATSAGTLTGRFDEPAALALVRRVLPDGRTGGWAAAYTSYSLPPYGNRLAHGLVGARCHGRGGSWARHHLRFPGPRGLGYGSLVGPYRTPFFDPIGLWNHPLGWRFGPWHATGCGLDLTTLALLFGRHSDHPAQHPAGGTPPPTDGGGRGADLPRPPIQHRVRVPPLLGPPGGEPAGAEALRRVAVPLPALPDRLEPAPAVGRREAGRQGVDRREGARRRIGATPHPTGIRRPGRTRPTELARPAGARARPTSAARPPRWTSSAPRLRSRPSVSSVRQAWPARARPASPPRARPAPPPRPERRAKPRRSGR